MDENGLTVGDKDGECNENGDCWSEKNQQWEKSQSLKTAPANTIPFPIVIGGTGTIATAAAGGLVVGAAYLFITRTTDAVVANHEDKEISAARLSVISVENALFMSKNKDTLRVIKGLVAAAAIELGKVTGGDPGDNHHRQEGRAMLDRAKRLAERLPGKFKDAVLQGALKVKYPGVWNDARYKNICEQETQDWG